MQLSGPQLHVAATISLQIGS